MAVFLYYISDEGHYRKIANAFGIGRPTVSKIVRKVAQIITTILGPRYIKMPSTWLNSMSQSAKCPTFFLTHPVCLVLS